MKLKVKKAFFGFLLRKKRGQQPTGILVHTAKATGFTSVSEMLFRKAPENIGHDDIVKGQPKSAALEKV